jgi:ubiquinone biosynthesis protein
MFAMAPLLAAAGSNTAERLRRLEEALTGPAGEALRQQVGKWASRVVPVEMLVPETAQQWRPVIRDAIAFVFAHLSAGRLARKLVEQADLPAATAPERRLIQLISKMPALQKMGQVLARNRRIAPSLRTVLSELENGMSDVRVEEVHGIIREQIGDRLQKFAVEIEPGILSEASVSAVIRFSWQNPDREREYGVFKVLKPYVPECFAEDTRLLQDLGAYLCAKERGYGFAARDVNEMLSEVRLLLQHELDFGREQVTLAEAHRTYQGTLGVRVPKVFHQLCTPQITAMSEEAGVKVTDAFPRSPVRRSRIADQLIAALIAVPLFSNRDPSVFHADPHAGNLLYDEPNRELVLLDWALAERLSLESRRQLVMLAIMTILQNPDGVREAVIALRRRGSVRVIARTVKKFFAELPAGSSPGLLDAMRLLDEIALKGVHFDAPLFLFRKSLFTLDGVLHDVAGDGVRMDHVVARHFLTRWAASFGLFYSPLGIRDFLKVEWNALLYPVRRVGSSSPALRPHPFKTR